MNNFKKFTPQNCASTRKGECRVSFSTKSGSISFTKEASAKMDLGTDKKISFLQSEIDPREWLVYLSEDGFPLRSKDEKTFMIQSTSLCKTIIGCAKISVKSTSMLIGQPVEIEGVEAFPIIISSAKNRENA